MDTYRRSRSHSRFPPPEDLSYSERAHRTRSLDNRKDFDGYPYDTSAAGSNRNRAYHSSSRDHFADTSPGRRRDDFFNESITIPIQKESAAAGTTANDDNEWQSYDRQVRYNHERNVWPSRRQFYEEQRSMGAAGEPPPPPPQGISPRSAASRYPDSEYFHRSHRVHRPLEYTRSTEGAAAHRTAASGEHFERQQHFDDVGTLGPPATSGGTLGTRSGGGHRSHHHYAREHHYGGGGASSGTVMRGGAVNGGSYGFKQQKRYGESGGGFFGTEKRTARGPNGEPLYHKVHCCCFSFKWPPWSYEQCEPPRPMYPQSAVGQPYPPAAQPYPSSPAGQPYPQSPAGLPYPHASPGQMYPPQPLPGQHPPHY